MFRLFARLFARAPRVGDHVTFLQAGQILAPLDYSRTGRIIKVVDGNRFVVALHNTRHALHRDDLAKHGDGWRVTIEV